MLKNGGPSALTYIYMEYWLFPLKALKKFMYVFVTINRSLNVCFNLRCQFACYAWLYICIILYITYNLNISFKRQLSSEFFYHKRNRVWWVSKTSRVGISFVWRLYYFSTACSDHGVCHRQHGFYVVSTCITPSDKSKLRAAPMRCMLCYALFKSFFSNKQRGA